MTLKTLHNIGFVLSIILGTANLAHAQFGDCNPYNYDECEPKILQHRFNNVIVNAPGLEWAFVAITNETSDATKVDIKVTLPGKPVRVFVKTDIPMDPGEALPPELISLWPELQGYQGGVSVSISATRTVTASVAMHPKIDTKPGDPGHESQLINYWRYAKFLF